MCRVSFLFVLLVGCGATTGPGSAGPQMAMLGSARGADGLTTERYDLSGDKKADLWKKYKTIPGKDGAEGKKILVEKHMDLNWDNKVDVKQYLDEDGKIYREEMDLDFDGNIDAEAHYKNGVITKRLQELTFDGRPDILKFYEDGKLIRKERDSDRDGKIDVWEYYEKGKIVRLGRDRDGDGKPEVFDEAPEQPPELAEEPAEKPESK